MDDRVDEKGADRHEPITRRSITSELGDAMCRGDDSSGRIWHLVDWRANLSSESAALATGHPRGSGMGHGSPRGLRGRRHDGGTFTSSAVGAVLGPCEVERTTTFADRVERVHDSRASRRHPGRPPGFHRVRCPHARRWHVRSARSRNPVARSCRRHRFGASGGRCRPRSHHLTPRCVRQTVARPVSVGAYTRSRECRQRARTMPVACSTS